MTGSRYGSRKFILALLVLASASVLVWFARIDAGVYSAVVIAVVGGYFAANVTQKRLDPTAAGTAGSDKASP